MPDHALLVQLHRSLRITPAGLAVTDGGRPNPFGPPVVVRCQSCPPLPDGRARPVAECVCWDEWVARAAR